jgi:hypothetical protein
MRRALGVLAAFAAGVMVAAAVLAAKPRLAATGAPAASGFAEVEWPFLMDQWGPGKAFACRAAACGTDIGLYLRAKIGFCNCATGVSDDEELDRVGDVDLFGNDFAPLATGHAVVVGGMAGRSRPYRISGKPIAGKPAAGLTVLAVAFSNRCDVIVATVAARDAAPGDVEPATLAFLNGEVVQRWTRAALRL